jgi:acetolactate synthase small subunit
VNPSPSYPTPAYQEPAHKSSGLLIALVAGGLIALVAANIYLYVQVDHLRDEVSKVRESLSTELSNLRDASSVTTASQLRHLETMKADLEAARTQARDQARSLSSQAKAEAQAHADQLARQIQSEEAKVQQQVSSEISEVKSAANTANAKIADVSTDVGGVKTQVTATQAELQKTIADLKSTRGDLGVQSGLIARNQEELDQLKRSGERNIFELHLTRSKTPTHVGPIQVTLTKTDPKKFKYTLMVVADDKTIEKKDKTADEPVQFYIKGATKPYEIVVFDVTKDKVNGYLSTPKDVGSARAQ